MKTRYLILFSTLLSPYIAKGMMPVIDLGEIAKTMSVINQLNQQYQSLQKQYSQMQEQYQSITGNYGWGKYRNTLSTLTQAREWTPSSWSSALKGMAGGNQARYEQLLNQYKQNQQVLSSNNYQKGSNATLTHAYSNQVKTNQVSATQASYEFNNINKHLNALYQLGKSIEQAKNLKSAIDLNSRIEVEIGYITVEELRMQTLLNEQSAQSQANKIANESEAAQYNQAGENT